RRGRYPREPSLDTLKTPKTREEEDEASGPHSPCAWRDIRPLLPCLRLAVLLRSSLVPEPDSFQPTVDSHGGADPDAGSQAATVQREEDLPTTQPPQTAVNPAGSPDRLDTGTVPTLTEMPAGPVGRYPVLGEIGHGGMGVVLLSCDPELGRELALKVMRRGGAGRPHALQPRPRGRQRGGAER